MPLEYTGCGVVPCGGPKKSPVHSFNALIIPILRGCLQSLFNIETEGEVRRL